MKKEHINLGWYIPIALLGILGFLFTLLTCLEVGGNYYVEYAIGFIASISVFGFGTINIFLEIYNDFIEKEGVE